MAIIVLGVIAVLSMITSCITLYTLRRMERIDAAKDFTDTEKGQIRQILNMMMFDGNPHGN
ncbi:MAG: hypothetical protein E7190_00380 [Erysipelotrichaceae bacterium]|nr:hypothetical protein [Erysipelotrichaceae bacterium]